MHGQQTFKTRVKLGATTTGVIVIALCALGFAGGGAEAADAVTPVKLGTTEQFSVLAGGGITHTGTEATTVQGDIGTFPTTDMTITGVAYGGTNQGGNGVTQGAKLDLVKAYDEAAGALSPTSVGTELGGTTLVGGVYNASTELGLTGTLTLDGGKTDGTASNSVFIFQAGTTLITGVDSKVALTGGAQACNVFWQVGSSAVFKTGTHFEGTVMAYTEAIIAQKGATFVGRLLARNGAVTLENNSITLPECAPLADVGDTEGTDTEGTDTEGTDTEGTDTEGTDTEDDTATGGTDSGTTTGGTDSGTVTGGTDSGTAADQDTSAVEAASADTPLPDTGGSPWILLPIGAVAVLAGWTVLASRPRARRH